jgi:hypothetical protein
MITAAEIKQWPHLGRKPLGYWLIEARDGRWQRIAISGERGTDEYIAHFEKTKAAMGRHLDRLERGGFDVRHLRRELA